MVDLECLACKISKALKKPGKRQIIISTYNSANNACMLV